MFLNIEAELTGMVWKTEVETGQKVARNEVLIVLESMKMEIAVTAPRDGTVKEILYKEGDAVFEGDVLIIMEI